jgi:hypothetical protein
MDLSPLTKKLREVGIIHAPNPLAAVGKPIAIEYSEEKLWEDLRNTAAEEGLTIPPAPKPSPGQQFVLTTIETLHIDRNGSGAVVVGLKVGAEDPFLLPEGYQTLLAYLDDVSGGEGPGTALLILKVRASSGVELPVGITVNFVTGP